MKKRFVKKVIATVMALAMTVTLVPQGQLFWRGINVEAAGTQLLTKAEVDALAKPVPYQRQTVHDPSIIKNGSDYYVFGSHMGVAKTTDLKNWSATPISDQNRDNAYYGTRDAQGNVTKVSFDNAFKKAAYGKTTVKTADGSTVEVDFTNFPASDWNTAISTNPDASGKTFPWVVEGNMWAPDVIYNDSMKKYCLYLSLNGNVWNTMIVLMTSDQIEGPYVYEAPIIYSGFTASGVTDYKKTDLSLVLNNGKELSALPARYNNLITGVNSNGIATSSSHGSYGTFWPHAIDPCVFFDDDGRLWMGYGSWSGGIYMIELDKTTGLRDYTKTYNFEVNGTVADASKANANVTSDPYFGKKIAGGYYVSGEGAYIEKIGKYYFLFLSYGFYSPTGGYNMRIFRSENPDGPYVDVNNVNAIYTSGGDNYRRDSRGLQLMGNYQWDTMAVAEIAQGHNSAYLDEDGNAYVIYHTKFADGTAGHQLRVHQLYLNEDGWIVAAPYEYAGEKVNATTIGNTAIPEKDIIGDYNLIVHKYTNPKATDNGTIEANVDIATPVNITLNADKTITGTHTGTWSEKAGTAYATININNVEYKGVFAEQTIDGTNIKTMCFTAVNRSGACIWGSKKLRDDVVVAYNVNCKKMTVPSSASKNLTLNTKGEFGAEIAWSSSDTSLLSNDGKVFPQANDQEITLSKVITKGNYSYQQDYPLVICGTEGENADKLMTYHDLQAGEPLMGVSAINANTGVSLTFTETGITSDWTPIFTTSNGENVFLSVLNYGGENIFEAAGTLSDEAIAAGLAPWAIFTDGKTHKVTISYNVNGSIEFYRDDVLMLTYAANTAIGKNTVASLAKAMTNAVRQGGVTVQYGMTDVSIGYALDYDGSEIDTSQYLYYQDYEQVSDASQVWTSANAPGNLTIASDGEHGNYLSYSFAGDTATNSRGAESRFQYKDPEGNPVTTVDGKYTIEFDALLKAGNNQESQFAILGTDKAYNSNNMNYGVVSGYLLRLSTTNSTTWTINGDSSKTVTIPNNAWVHIKAVVSTDKKMANITIENGSKVLYKDSVVMNGTGSLYGLYSLAGRYQASTFVDNIKVYQSLEENTGTITAETEGSLYLDTVSPVTVTFCTDGTLSANDVISINGQIAKAGDTIDKITVDSIDYKEKEIAVHLKAAPISGWHKNVGSYKIALLDSYSDEVASKTLEYNLESLSENSAYASIAAEEKDSCGYYKVVGTKLYFLTIIKSNKIHCDGVAAGGTTYAWWNGIASELYIIIDGTKYNVGSHVFNKEFANAITWNNNPSLIQDGSSAMRAFMEFGTFDNDNDIDKGCVLLNEVDLADIGYTISSLKGKEFTLSGFLGPNDGGSAFAKVDDTNIYTIPGYSAKVSGKAYPDVESEVTVTFQSTGTMGSDSIIKINGKDANVGDTVDLATVKSITYNDGTAQVVLKMAAMQGMHSIPGTYQVTIHDSLANELAAGNIEYELAMSDNTEYEQIKTASNPNASAYYKVDGTKMYFLTLVKTNKVHSSNITAGNVKYEWWNGMASELYMKIDGKKYSVGSHIHDGKYANPIGWGTGTQDNSFENTLIEDGSSAARSYMAFGTFDNDDDVDKGCILLNVVDLKDINYTAVKLQGEEITFSGYLGPNDGNGSWVQVDDKSTYTLPSYSVNTENTAILDKESKIIITFQAAKSIKDSYVVMINGTTVKQKDKKDLATVESITYEEKTVTVVLNMAAISGTDNIPGIYHVALATEEEEELAFTEVKYALELSADTEYKKITSENNPHSSAYLKINGTKMHFLTIVKSNKIHSDGIQVGDTAYGWWNGIASELYMTIGEKKYSVGSHVFQGNFANPIGWGTGTENDSFENNLITGKSAVRGFMALGTFDNDDDLDEGCVLVTTVDLADISDSQTMDKLVFNLSGNLGPNDGSGAWAAVTDSQYYVISDENLYLCTRTYTEPTCLENGYYIYEDQNGFQYKQVEEGSAKGHKIEITYADQTITVSCSEGDSTKKLVLDTNGGSIHNQYQPDTSIEKDIIALPTGDTIAKAGYIFKGWSDTISGSVKYQEEVELSKILPEDGTATVYAIWESSEAPTGSITIADTVWHSFLETITFGIYKSSQEEITIDAQAQNGIKAIQYLIATDGVSYTMAELMALPETDWRAYNASAKPTLQKDTKNVVYAKLEDTIGTIVYISSNGIIEDETAPRIIEFETIAGELTDNSVAFHAQADEDCMYYLAIFKDSEDILANETNIESAIMANAVKSDAMIAGKDTIISKTGLEKGTDYNAYLVVKDAAGNISSYASALFMTAQEMIKVTNAELIGEAVYGSDLLADASNEQNITSYSYQWYRSDKPITDSTNLSELTLIGKAVKGEYTVQKADIGKYLAVTIAVSHEYYAGSGRAYTKTPVQPKAVVATASVKDKAYDGNTDAEISEIILDGVVTRDEVTAMAGTATFENEMVGNDKEVTISDIVLKGADAVCYQLKENTIKAVANISKSEYTPNMPNASEVWNISSNITKVSEVELPTDWIWLAEDAEKELVEGSTISATAIYNGKDKGNYVTESIQISLQKSACVHTETEIRDEKPASCTEVGYSGDTYCKSCGQLVFAGSLVSVLGHSFVEYRSNQDATCTEDGTKTAKCERCEETKTVIDEGSKIGHTIVIDPGVDATCTAIGKTEGKHCSVCGEVLEEQKGIAALGHNYTEEVTKEPSCTEAGMKTFLCVCGDKYTEDIKALGHDYKSEITKPATITEHGIKTFTCNKCGNKYTEEIPKLTGGATDNTGNTGNNGSNNVVIPGNNTNTNNPDTEKDEDKDTEKEEPKPLPETPEEPNKTVTTETKPDGTKIETVTETKEDNTVIITSTETKPDGSITNKKEIQLEDKSALLIVVETTADGKNNANSIIRTGVSNAGGTVNIAENLLLEIAEDERLNNIVVEITEATISSAAGDNKNTIVNVNIPSVEKVEVEKVVLTKESIKTAKAAGKGLVINVVNGCADKGSIDNYKVEIPVKQLAKIDDSIYEINIGVIVEPVANVSDISKKDTITGIINKNKGKKKKTCVVSLAANENVKAGMKVTISVTEKTTISKGSNVYVYKYNPKTGKLVETANCKQTVAENGTVMIAATPGSDYVISAKKLSGTKVKTIKDNISISVSKRTAKVKKTLKVNVSLPNTVSKKAKFGAERAVITYKSSNNKIASVSKNGVITTKKKGTAVIITTVKLASGQKVTEKQKITVK